MFWEKFVGLCAEVGKSPTAVVLELDLSRSSVTNWKKGGTPNNVAIRKIANYFNVSVNYLIGNGEKTIVQDNNISGTYNVIGNSNPQLNINGNLTSQEQELLSCFRKLSEVGKAKALIYISELGESAKDET